MGGQQYEREMSLEEMEAEEEWLEKQRLWGETAVVWGANAGIFLGLVAALVFGVLGVGRE